MSNGSVHPPSPGEQGDASSAVTMLDGAQRLGRFCWTERTLFALLGGWVADLDEPEAKILVSVHSRHHGERAGWWFSRLPEIAQLPAEELVLPPPGPLAEVIQRAAAPTGSPGTPLRLTGLYRVLLPRLHVDYLSQLDGFVGLGDAPVRRTFDFVLTDLARQRLEGESLLQRLLDRAETVATCSRWQAELEADLVGVSSVFS